MGGKHNKIKEECKEETRPKRMHGGIKNKTSRIGGEWTEMGWKLIRKWKENRRRIEVEWIAIGMIAERE